MWILSETCHDVSEARLESVTRDCGGHLARQATSNREAFKRSLVSLVSAYRGVDEFVKKNVKHPHALRL
jgi:hypothetical protein